MLLPTTLPVETSSANICAPKMDRARPEVLLVSRPEMEEYVDCSLYNARMALTSAADKLLCVNAGKPYKPFFACRGCIVAPITPECGRPSKCPISCAKVDSKS